MVELLEGLAKITTELVKAGAARPVVGFACFPFCVTFIDTAATFPTNTPHYWLTLLFAVIVGGLGHSCHPRLCHTQVSQTPRLDHGRYLTALAQVPVGAPALATVLPAGSGATAPT